MHKTRVYVDTSVFGGAADEEFSEHSRRFFQRVENGDFLLVTSSEVIRELRDAPQIVRELFASMLDVGMESAPIDSEVEALAEAYVDAGVLGRASRSDALHVAAATVAETDVIVSWNFKHIVNYGRIRKYNAVNALKLYRPIEIRSPSELYHDDESEDL